MAQFPSKLTIAFSWGLLPLFIISLLSQMSEFEDAFTLDFPVMSGVYWKQPHTFEVERHGLVHSILYRSYIVEIHRCIKGLKVLIESPFGVSVTFHGLPLAPGES